MELLSKVNFWHIISRDILEDRVIRTEHQFAVRQLDSRQLTQLGCLNAGIRKEYVCVRRVAWRRGWRACDDSMVAWQRRPRHRLSHRREIILNGTMAAAKYIPSSNQLKTRSSNYPIYGEWSENQISCREKNLLWPTIRGRGRHIRPPTLLVNRMEWNVRYKQNLEYIEIINVYCKWKWELWLCEI